MENSNINKSLIIVVIVVALCSSIIGSIIGANFVSRRNNINVNNNLPNNKDEENNNTEVVKKPNEFFDNLLEPYKDAAGDFEINNIDNKFLAQFVLNYYVFGKKLKLQQLDNQDYDFKTEISKKDVSNLINSYFYQSNVILDNFENKDYYKLENSGDKYIIYVKNTDYDFADMTITNVSYNGNEITVKYTLKMPYEPYEEVGNTVYKIKYENGSYKIQSKKTTMTKEW